MYPILDTRVECKVIFVDVPMSNSFIRIEPDWNVKDYRTLGELFFFLD